MFGSEADEGGRSSTPDYKPGDRVQITFEAEVKEVDTSIVGEPWLEVYAFNTEYGVPLFGDNPAGVEKLTPDYEQQVRDLEPGTAFVLTVKGTDIPYLRTHSGVSNARSNAYTVEALILALGEVTAMRVLS